jgi:hypothetical protein
MPDGESEFGSSSRNPASRKPVGLILTCAWCQTGAANGPASQSSPARPGTGSRSLAGLIRTRCVLPRPRPDEHSIWTYDDRRRTGGWEQRGGARSPRGREPVPATTPTPRGDPAGRGEGCLSVAYDHGEPSLWIGPRDLLRTLAHPRRPGGTPGAFPRPDHVRRYVGIKAGQVTLGHDVGKVDSERPPAGSVGRWCPCGSPFALRALNP